MSASLHDRSVVKVGSTGWGRSPKLVTGCDGVVAVAEVRVDEVASRCLLMMGSAGRGRESFRRGAKAQLIASQDQPSIHRIAPELVLVMLSAVSKFLPSRTVSSGPLSVEVRDRRLGVFAVACSVGRAHSWRAVIRF